MVLSSSEIDSIIAREREWLRTARAERAAGAGDTTGDIDSLIAERSKLTAELANCERGAHPASAASRRESAALLALGDFDRSHPEVITEIHKRSQDKTLKGVDVAGL